MREGSSKENSQQPPVTIDDLRTQLEEIQRDAGKRRLGKGSLSVLVQMLDNPHSTAVKTCTQLAQEYGVDPSTLTRIGQRLGFNGFTGLQQVFRQYIGGRGDFYSRQARSLMDELNPTTPDFVRDLANREIVNLVTTVEQLKNNELDRAVDYLANAQRVYIMGLRGTYSVAFFFAAFLRYLRPSGHLVGSPGTLLAEDLAQITSRDVLVAFSFRPYTNATVKACYAVQARNVPVIAITDTASPIPDESRNAVALYARSPFYFNSAIANFFIAEIVLAALAIKLGDGALKHLHAVEDLIREMGIEVG